MTTQTTQSPQTGGFYSCEGVKTEQNSMVVAGTALSATDTDADISSMKQEDLRQMLAYIRENQRRNTALPDADRKMLDLIFEHLDHEDILDHEYMVEHGEHTPGDEYWMLNTETDFEQLQPGPSAPWTEPQGHPVSEALENTGMTVYDVIFSEPADADLAFCECRRGSEECPACRSLIYEATMEPALYRLSMSDRIAQELDIDLSVSEGTAEIDQMLVETGMRR